MQDIKLREAFRALVRHLNLRVEDFYGYSTRNYPEASSCNIARRADIERLQKQIDKIQQSQKNVKKKR